MGKDTTVLIVEDQPAIRELYETFLKTDYTVRTAQSVSNANDIVDHNVDVVLLDRRLPDGSGGEVLEAIRDRQLDCRVAMVTAVVPDFDIVDLGFDHYIVKPATKAEIVETVDALLDRSEYDEKLRRLASLVSKRVLLETEKSEGELAASEEYSALTADISTLQSDVEDISARFTSLDFRAMFRDIGSAM